jgi:hypothetical protein
VSLFLIFESAREIVVMAGAAAKGRTAGAALPPLVIRYMRRMKRQRVYSYEVSWSRKPAADRQVVVRLVAAGAQVVPAERALEPAGKALFYVTPLVHGPLRAERLEVLVDGRKVQELPLPGRVVSQRSTWVLLALTFLVPWLWSTYVVGDDRSYAPGTELHAYLTGQRVVKARKGETGQTSSKSDSTASHFVKQLNEWERDIRGLDSSDPTYVNDVIKNVTDNLDGLHGLDWQQNIPIGFYLFAGLLLLTLISWFLHRDKRRRRLTPPVPLPESEAGSPPLAARRATVEALG